MACCLCLEHIRAIVYVRKCRKMTRCSYRRRHLRGSIRSAPIRVLSEAPAAHGRCQREVYRGPLPLLIACGTRKAIATLSSLLRLVSNISTSAVSRHIRAMHLIRDLQTMMSTCRQATFNVARLHLNPQLLNSILTRHSGLRTTPSHPNVPRHGCPSRASVQAVSTAHCSMPFPPYRIAYRRYRHSHYHQIPPIYPLQGIQLLRNSVADRRLRDLAICNLTVVRRPTTQGFPLSDR